MRLNYKQLAIIVLIISAMFLILLRNTSISEYITEILISLCINIISSIIIIFMLNVKIENRDKEILKKRRQIVYKALIPSILQFDQLIYNMYKATTNENQINIHDFNENKLNLDKIFNNIQFIDLTKPGNRIDIYNKKRMIWQEIIIIDYLMYIQQLKEFYTINSQYMDNKLSELIYKIISHEGNRQICNHILRCEFIITGKDLIKVLDLQEIFVLTNKIKSLINEYVDTEDLINNKKIILRNDISPKYASGIKN